MNDPMTPVLYNVEDDVLRDAKIARSEKVVERVLNEITDAFATLNKQIGLDSITRMLTLDFEGAQNEIEVHVQYRSYPARVALFDEPGSGAYCEIRSVIFRGQDITGLLGSEIQQAMAEDICEGLE